MDIRYSEFCSINAFHSYYESGICPSLQFHPTISTQKVLNNYGLINRSSNGHLEVWSNELIADRESTFKSLRQGNEKLTYVLTIDDPLFMNITELPEVDQKTNIYYFSNQNAEQRVYRDNDITSLTKDVVVGAADRVKFFPKIFIYEPGMSLLEENIKIVSPEQETVDAACVTYRKKFKNYSIDLSNYPDGLFRFSIVGKTFNYYICNDFSWKRPFGVIDVYFNESVKSKHSIVDPNGKLTPSDYAIVFKARSTYWKYFIINIDTDADHEGLVITNEKENTYFNGPVSGNLADHENVKVFESVEVMELKEKPRKVFRLMKNYIDKDQPGSVVIDRLPYPDIQLIKKGAQADPNSFISEMFIY